MKKQILFTGVFLAVFCMPLQIVAQLQNHQSTVNPRFGNQETKTVSKARNIALTNTIMPIATGVGAVSIFEDNTVQTIGSVLAVYGMTMGPSTGNFYAQDYTRGFIGVGVRALGLFLMHDATSEIFGRTFADRLYVDDRKVRLTDTKILIGEALLLGSAIYNILSTKQSVREYQETGRSFALNISSTSINHKVAPLLTACIRF